jgi:hypothetical protein
MIRSVCSYIPAFLIRSILFHAFSKVSSSSFSNLQIWLWSASTGTWSSCSTSSSAECFSTIWRVSASPGDQTGRRNAPYQSFEGRYWLLFVECHDSISRQLELEVRSQPLQHFAVRLQGFDQTRRWPVAKLLCYRRQDLAIRGFVTSSMWCAEKENALGGILNWLVLRLEPSLE